MTVTINGTTGITTPDLESEGPVVGTTGTFSGNLTLGSSTLATPTGSAPSYLCRAWVNFNGSGTVAIRASGNVTSITDNGTGDYIVNFTTAMPDANYATQIGVNDMSWGGYGTVINTSETLTNRVRIYTFRGSDNTSNRQDTDLCSVAIFR